jgi:hypothetical protein
VYKTKQPDMSANDNNCLAYVIRGECRGLKCSGNENLRSSRNDEVIVNNLR